MNKNVSLAIEKAVSNLDKIESKDLKDLNDKKPDLFSLSHATELFQNCLMTRRFTQIETDCGLMPSNNCGTDAAARSLNGVENRFKNWQFDRRYPHQDC